MDPSTSVAWSGAVAPVVVAGILLLAPGLALARALGLDRYDAVGVSAPLGLAVLVVAGAATDLAGVAWSPAVGVLVLALLTGLGGVSARLVTRRGPDPVPSGSGRWTVLGFAVGVGVAGAGTAWQIVRGTSTPDAVSQMPDIQFHLQAVDQLIRLDSASPLRSGDVWFYDPIGYPGGFHSLAATVAQWTGTDADVASHATLLVCAALVWPLGMVALVRRVVSANAWVLASSGALALSLAYAPVALMPLGGAWANLVAASMVPGALVPLALACMRPDPPPVRGLVAALLASAVATAAAALAQPNAAYTIAVLGLTLTAPTVWSWGRRWAFLHLAAVLVMVVAWVVPRQQAMLDVPVDPDLSVRRAVLVLLKNGDVPLWAGGVLALLTLGGVAVAVVSRGWRGIAFAWLVTSGFAFLFELSDLLPVAYLTWPWWSGYGRIVYMLGVAAVLAGSVAVVLVVDRLGRGPAWVPVAGGVVLLGVLLAAAAPATRQGEQAVHDSYAPADRRAYYVTDAELVELRSLADDLPPGSTLAVDPFAGGTFLNLMGARTVPIGPFYEGTPETDLVDARLDAAASDRTVCDAVAALGITHVLTGGDEVRYLSWLHPTYEGIAAVPGSTGFTRVAAAGDFEVYAVPPACASRP